MNVSFYDKDAVDRLIATVAGGSTGGHPDYIEDDAGNRINADRTVPDRIGYWEWGGRVYDQYSVDSSGWRWWKTSVGDDEGYIYFNPNTSIGGEEWGYSDIAGSPSLEEKPFNAKTLRSGEIVRRYHDGDVGVLALQSDIADWAKAGQEPPTQGGHPDYIEDSAGHRISSDRSYTDGTGERRIVTSTINGVTGTLETYSQDDIDHGAPSTHLITFRGTDSFGNAVDVVYALDSQGKTFVFMTNHRPDDGHSQSDQPDGWPLDFDAEAEEIPRKLALQSDFAAKADEFTEWEFDGEEGKTYEVHWVDGRDVPYWDLLVFEDGSRIDRTVAYLPRDVIRIGRTDWADVLPVTATRKRVLRTSDVQAKGSGTVVIATIGGTDIKAPAAGVSETRVSSMIADATGYAVTALEGAL